MKKERIEELLEKLQYMKGLASGRGASMFLNNDDLSDLLAVILQARAASDLLEACKAVMNDVNMGDSGLMNITRAIVRAAIAKVEGK